MKIRKRDTQNNKNINGLISILIAPEYCPKHYLNI